MRSDKEIQDAILSNMRRGGFLATIFPKRYPVTWDEIKDRDNIKKLFDSEKRCDAATDNLEKVAAELVANIGKSEEANRDKNKKLLNEAIGALVETFYLYGHKNPGPSRGFYNGLWETLTALSPQAAYLLGENERAAMLIFTNAEIEGPSDEIALEHGQKLLEKWGNES